MASDGPLIPLVFFGEFDEQLGPAWRQGYSQPKQWPHRQTPSATSTEDALNTPLVNFDANQNRNANRKDPMDAIAPFTDAIVMRAVSADHVYESRPDEMSRCMVQFIDAVPWPRSTSALFIKGAKPQTCQDTAPALTCLLAVPDIFARGFTRSICVCIVGETLSLGVRELLRRAIESFVQSAERKHCREARCLAERFEILQREIQRREDLERSQQGEEDADEAASEEGAGAAKSPKQTDYQPNVSFDLDPVLNDWLKQYMASPPHAQSRWHEEMESVTRRWGNIAGSSAATAVPMPKAATNFHQSAAHHHVPDDLGGGETTIHRSSNHFSSEGENFLDDWNHFTQRGQKATRPIHQLCDPEDFGHFSRELAKITRATHAAAAATAEHTPSSVAAQHTAERPSPHTLLRPSQIRILAHRVLCGDRLCVSVNSATSQSNDPSQVPELLCWLEALMADSPQWEKRRAAPATSSGSRQPSTLGAAQQPHSNSNSAPRLGGNSSAPTSARAGFKSQYAKPYDLRHSSREVRLSDFADMPIVVLSYLPSVRWDTVTFLEWRGSEGWHVTSSEPLPKDLLVGATRMDNALAATDPSSPADGDVPAIFDGSMFHVTFSRGRIASPKELAGAMQRLQRYYRTLTEMYYSGFERKPTAGYPVGPGSSTAGHGSTNPTVSNMTTPAKDVTGPPSKDDGLHVTEQGLFPATIGGEFATGPLVSQQISLNSLLNVSQIPYNLMERMSFQVEASDHQIIQRFVLNKIERERVKHQRPRGSVTLIF